jgi:hypothetical protein
LTGLPTEEITIVGTAKRISLETRITSPTQTALSDRITTPDSIDYNSKNPFNFIPREDYPPLEDTPYSPKELPPLDIPKINFYRDPRDIIVDTNATAHPAKSGPSRGTPRPPPASRGNTPTPKPVRKSRRASIVAT